MPITLVRNCICAVVTVCLAAPVWAVDFSDNFNTPGSAAAWTINAAPTANAGTQQATFAYDYSAMGIPAIPGNEDTLGLRLRSNIPIVGGLEVTSRPAGVTSGLSVSPTNGNFGTNYKMSFYAWANYIGAANAQGLADNANSEGGTFNVMAAVGTSGTVPIVVGNPTLVANGNMDGIGFATTGDGGIANDWRVYPKTGTFVPGVTAGVYAAGAAATSTTSSATFYTDLFPSVTAPVEQQAIADAEYFEAFNTQLGNTPAGSFGFAWHKVDITKTANVITWQINGNLIATYDASAVTLGGNNVALGMSDVNASTTRRPSLVFTVFDNFSVTNLDPPTGLDGDYNDNDVVDAADYTVWRDNLGAPTEAALAGNGDGLNGVDNGDYTLWVNQFGQTAGAGAGAAVPEPTSLALVILLGAGFCWRRVR